MAKKNGRPRKYDRDVLLKNLLKYMEETDIPILAEFAYKNGVHREELYGMEELSYAIKLLMSKKEGALERGGLEKTVNHSMAIFSLKQMGWRDVQEIGVNDSFAEIAKSFAQMVRVAGAGRVSSGDKPVSE